jgi:hypothetical protein
LAFSGKGWGPLTLYFHGNGGALVDRVLRFRMLTARGYGLLAVSYRGRLSSRRKRRICNQVSSTAITSCGRRSVDRFHLGRLSGLLHDPAGTLRAAYANDLQTVADATAMADKLFPRILAILRMLETG